MNLSLLPEPPAPEPLGYTGTEDAAGARATLPSSARKKVLGGRSDEEENVDEPKDHNDSASSSSSSSDSDEEDFELSQLMREPSDYASSSDESEQESKPHPAPSKKKELHGLYDSPTGNIAVLVVACWTLRLPVTYMDFIQCVHTSKMLP